VFWETELGPDHPYFANSDVKKVKSLIAEAITNMEAVVRLILSTDHEALKPFEDKARTIRDLAEALKRDLDHVI